MHIAVAGNIGAGKTSLTELLSKHYKWESNFEDVIDNPYLDDFYNFHNLSDSLNPLHEGLEQRCMHLHK